MCSVTTVGVFNEVETTSSSITKQTSAYKPTFFLLCLLSLEHFALFQPLLAN